jgi:hypothetical protein
MMYFCTIVPFRVKQVGLALSIVLQLHRKIEVKCQSELFFAAAISSGEEAVIPTTLYPLAVASYLVALILPFHFDQHALNHKR